MLFLKPALIIGFVLGLCAFGWVNNLVQLLRCDFASPYKAEILRTVGVFVPPIGMVEGYLSIKD